MFFKETSMHFHILSFFQGALISSLIVLGTLTAFGQVDDPLAAARSRIINIQQEELVEAQVQLIDSQGEVIRRTIPIAVGVDLKISLNGEVVQASSSVLAESSQGTSSGEKIVFFPIPDGSTKNLLRNIDTPNENALNLILPNFSFSEVREPMTFQNRIGMVFNIKSSKAQSNRPGDGIRSVKFTIKECQVGARTCSYGKVVYEREDTTSLYCLFGGNTFDQCEPKTFAELNYRWKPYGKPIYNGRHEVNILVETDDNSGEWNFPIFIKGALERPQY